MFNIRVYGIWLDAGNRVLVSDEFVKDFFFTKFPGGGMEYGEGTRDCLKREFKEEIGIDVEVGAHFYTTDLFQASAFKGGGQVVAIYYYVQPIGAYQFVTSNGEGGFSEEQLAKGKGEQFRWIKLDKLAVEDLTFPIDQVVVRMLKAI